MNIRILVPLCLTLLFSATNTLASDGKVLITSPANDATVSQRDTVALSYEAVAGSEGDHLHLYLDGKRVDVIRQLKGSASVGMLPPGRHHICLEVNTRGHVPTGAETCVDVTAK